MVVKTKYYEENVDNNKHDPKLMWQTLKNMISGKNSQTYNEIEFTTGICNDNKSIADQFNQYFIHSIKEIVSTIPVNNSYEVDVAINNRMDAFKLLEFRTLKDIIFTLPNKSSPDDIAV